MFRLAGSRRALLGAGALRRALAPRAYSSVHEKYATKLAAKAQQHGVSVETLLEQSKDKAEAVRKADVADLVKQAELFRKPRAPAAPDGSAAPGGAEATSGASSASSASQLAAASAAASKPKIMDLNTYVDVEKLRPHSKKEIEMLWKARFVGKATEICGAMNADTFARLYVAARKMPTFVLPLPHKTHGVELHYVQWSFVASHTIHCLFTSLAEYKLHNEYAHPHTTFMMHTDLAADKDVVLTNTVVQNNEVPLESAVFLTLNLQRFYTADPDSKHGAEKLLLLQQFNSGDANFSAERLIEATETLD